MPCKYDKYINDYLSGKLSDVDKEILLEHSKTCFECSSKLDRINYMETTIKTELNNFPFKSNKDKIMIKVDANKSRPSILYFFHRVPKVAYALVVLCIFIVSFIALHQISSAPFSNEPLSVKSSSSSDAGNQKSGINSSSEKYKMSVYTEVPNKKSSIKIQYPIFSGNGFDALNTLVYNKVQSFAKIDTSLYPSDTGLTIDYQSAVTLQNSKIISIIFWGSTNIERSAHPFSYLIPLNIDLQSMKEITLKDLYTTNADFEKVFFDKAFFPTNPITSYDKASFPDMLKLQSSEYQTVDPFSIPNNVSCFLKSDGIVLSMHAVHGTGSDHFEAQLNYSDIQQFYLLGQNYWENANNTSNKSSSLFDNIDTSKSSFEKGYYDYQGTISNNMSIQMSIYPLGTDMVGTYFYNNQRKEIKLQGKAGEKNIVLYEYDETGKNTGIFQGTLSTVDKIEGTWTSTDGKKNYPFTLSLKSALPGAEYGKRYSVAIGTENDKDVENFVSKIQSYVIKDDKENLSLEIQYPINVKVNDKVTTIQNKDDFIKNYDQIFYPDYKQVISNAYTKYLFANWRGIMFGEGSYNIWISESNSKLIITAINN